MGPSSGAVSRHLGILEGSECPPPPPERGRCGTLGVGVALGFSWEPSAGSSSGDGGEGAIRVVWNDEGDSSVKWLHGRGHEMKGLKVPM